MIKMLCYLLEGLLVPENTPPDCNKELYELYFVFAAVWAFGGAMFQDQVRHSSATLPVQSISPDTVITRLPLTYPLSLSAG